MIPSPIVIVQRGICDGYGMMEGVPSETKVSRRSSEDKRNVADQRCSAVDKLRQAADTPNVNVSNRLTGA